MTQRKVKCNMAGKAPQCAQCDHVYEHAPREAWWMENGHEAAHLCDKRKGWCSYVNEYTLCVKVEGTDGK